MAYGELKVDSITFTDGGSDTTVSVSGLVKNPTFSGDIVVSGNISGTTITGDSAGFGSVTGVTVTGTTANFVTVSGTTVTGNTGNFTSVSATTATITSGVFASGTAAAPSVSVGTTDNGLYSPGTDQVAISTNGAQALYIDSDGDILVADGNRMEIDEIRARDGAGLKLFDDGGAGIFIEDGGNVGLGTSSPGAGFHLTSAGQATAALDTTGDLNFILSDSGSNANNGGSLVFAANNGSWRFASIKGLVQNGGGNSRGDIAFSTRNTTADAALSEKMRITYDGLVGIGTTSPGSALEIDAAAATSPFIAKINTSEAARIDSSGRLLIGTSSQSGGSLLQVNDDRIRIASSKTPASASDTGTAGEICWDSSYIYVCTATDTWKRAALSTW